jgi:hypothetical protein
MHRYAIAAAALLRLHGAPWGIIMPVYNLLLFHIPAFP